MLEIVSGRDGACRGQQKGSVSLCNRNGLLDVAFRFVEGPMPYEFILVQKET